MDDLQAGRELDALVAEKVMGWPVHRAKRSRTTGEWTAGPIINQWQYLVLGDELRFYDRTNEGVLGKCWHPSEDIAAAWEVHRRACSWIFSKRKQYFEALQKQTHTENGCLIAWPDVLVVLRDKMPEAICLAALEVAKDGTPKPLQFEEETGWVTEPGWRYCDGKYSHVCKPNQAPIVICDWLIGFISCPECGATLSTEEAHRLADER